MIIIPLYITAKTSSFEDFLLIDQLIPWHSTDMKVPGFTALTSSHLSMGVLFGENL